MPGLYPNDASILDTAGRIIIVLFFVTVGLRNLSSWQVEDHVKRLEVAATPMPRQTFWAGVVLEFIGCALVLFNWHPVIGVLCLMAFTILATLLLLRFWDADDPIKRIGMQNGFMSNVCICGGLLLLLQRVM
jgi:putative oxidoreductase